MVNDWSCARARLYDFYNKSKFINNIFVRWEGNSPREKKNIRRRLWSFDFLPRVFIEKQ